MTTTSLHRELVWEQAEQLRSEGYDVLVFPARDRILETLPSYPDLANQLAGFRPDLIGRTSTERDMIVVEVANTNEPHSFQPEAYEELKALLDQHKIQLRIIDAIEEASKAALNAPTKNSIHAALDEATGLIMGGHVKSALLLTWSAFEATMRLVKNGQLPRPQLPKSVVSIAASEGFLLPEEVTFAKTMIEKRNRYIHGDINLAVDHKDVEKLIEIVRTVLDEAISSEAA
jgi:hypothetical protein